jgi:hypothetical protein
MALQLLTLARVVRELTADDGDTSAFHSLDTATATLFPDPTQRTRCAPALAHLLARHTAGVTWPATCPEDIYLPLAPDRAEWAAGGDLCAAVEVATMLHFDDAFMLALGTDVLRAAHTCTCDPCDVLCAQAFAHAMATLKARLPRNGLPIDLPATMADPLSPFAAVVFGRVPAELPPVLRAVEVVGELAAAFGRLAILEWLGAQTFFVDWGTISWVAAEHGHLACVQACVRLAEAHMKPLGDMNKSLKWAAGAGHMHIVEWLVLEHGQQPTSDAAREAARGGQWDVLRWLHARGAPLDGGILLLIVDHGRLDMVEWAVMQGCAVFPELTATAAVEHGHVSILEWLQEHGYMGRVERWNVCRRAAASGHVAVLEWLAAHGHWTGPADATYEAGRRGHFAALRWILARDGGWSEELCRFAASFGDVEMLAWLRARGCPWLVWHCVYETGWHGRLAALQWLDTHGAPLTTFPAIDRLQEVLASGGHLACLQLLVERGCGPITEVAVGVAAWYGHLAVLQWLHSIGSLGNVACVREAATRAERQHILEWLDALA